MDPWDFMVQIWSKRCLLKLIRPLRHLPFENIRTRGYGWYVKLCNSLYKCEHPKSDTLQDKKHRRDLWAEGLYWEIKDGTVEFPSEGTKVESRQYWKLSMFLTLYINDLGVVTDEEPAKDSQSLADEFFDQYQQIHRNIRWRKDQGIKTDEEEELFAAFPLAGIAQPWFFESKRFRLFNWVLGFICLGSSLSYSSEERQLREWLN
ncbi:hypothetical protein N431DRAFT_464092 [Stipitochalara longipes BDJ]|nr:hypothetical protein N431DRAFT_464092 [Stipitochalara longipes BDJ]